MPDRVDRRLADPPPALSSALPMSPGGWTIDTALQHTLSLIGANDHRYEQRFIDQERAVTMALATSKEATVKAEQAAEKRFDSVNEFRATLADQQRTLLPRSEAERAFAASDAKAVALEKQLDALGGQLRELLAERQGIKGGWGYAVGAVGFVLTVGTLILLVVNRIGGS